ncbi:MAG: hypothetical protein GX622_13910 [Bacteroidales bacterium]|nr:hypothetical protein [Bacteroidales bacterium]
MKRIIIPLLLGLTASCEILNDCPKLVMGKPDGHLVDDRELKTIKILFKASDLSYENYQFYGLQSNMSGQYLVSCHQFVNNLKVWTGDLFFHFDKDGKYESLTGEIVTAIDVGTSPVMDLSGVESRFLERVEEDRFYSNSRSVVNGCMTCELVYCDLSKMGGNSAPDYVLAWLVKPEKLDYPYAIVIDSDQSVVSYNNGIIY